MATALGDGAVSEVGLEEHTLPAKRLGRHVDLEKLVIRTLEAVLGLVELAEVGGDLARAQRAPLAGAEVEGLPDQTGLVGIDDASLGRPDLHPHDTVAQNAPADRRIDTLEARGVARQHTVVEHRLGNGVTVDARDVPRRANRLSRGTT